MIYQHTTQKADRKIAHALERLLDEHAEDAKKDDDDPDDGVAGVSLPAS